LIVFVPSEITGTNCNFPRKELWTDDEYTVCTAQSLELQRVAGMAMWTRYALATKDIKDKDPKNPPQVPLSTIIDVPDKLKDYKVALNGVIYLKNQFGIAMGSTAEVEELRKYGNFIYVPVHSASYADIFFNALSETGEVTPFAIHCGCHQAPPSAIDCSVELNKTIKRTIMVGGEKYILKNLAMVYPAVPSRYTPTAMDIGYRGVHFFC
jgi:hypothetical protein